MRTRFYFFSTALVIAAMSLATGSAKAQKSGPLFDEMSGRDSAMFAAFNSRNLDNLMTFFDPGVEWYQDNTGVRTYEQMRQAFSGLYKMDYVLTRKLVPGSMEVYSIKDFGAILTAQHTFSHVENGKLEVATFKYLEVWQKKDGVWKITREVSYGH